MVFSEKKIIDWELGAELVGGSRASAEEMLTCLVAEIPQYQRQLQDLRKQDDWPAIKSVAHKIHGGACYCGTPRLKQASKNLEVAIMENETEIEICIHFDVLINELHSVVEQYDKERQT